MEHKSASVTRLLVAFEPKDDADGYTCGDLRDVRKDDTVTVSIKKRKAVLVLESD